MKSGFYLLMGLVAAAAAAGAAPHGLSGLGLGFGGAFGDFDDAVLNVEADFAVPPYVALGPDLSLGFGDATALAGGLGGRVYFLAKMNYPVQPYMNFGGGIIHLFDVSYWGWTADADWTGGYIRFGAGTDFDIPNAPMAPYMQMGGLVAFGDGSAGEFEIRGGVRFALW
jgi:hypothetical protein